MLWNYYGWVAYQIELIMKMITIDNFCINVDSITHIYIHTVGKGRYEDLVPATRTALDIRSYGDKLIWTRIFSRPEEALWARDIILRGIGAGNPLDLGPNLKDLILPDQEPLF